MAPEAAVDRDATAFPVPALPDFALVAAFTLVWAIVALGFHPIGDHYTESDFYGAYANGARGLLEGRIDPTRYGIYGPAYEWALAAAGAIGLELFLAARLISVLSAAVVLAATWAIVARSLGRGAARWAVALVAATPVFTRYAYSATTDMLAAAFAASGLALVLLARGGRLRFLAGVLIALATLTRYQSVVLVAAGLVVPLLGGRTRGRHPLAGAASFALGLAVALVPWTAFSIARGVVPGQSLATNYRFYAAEDASRNVQDRLRGAADAAPPAASGETAAPATESTPELWLRRAGEHAHHDLHVLLGIGFGLAAAAGAVAWVARVGAGAPGGSASGAHPGVMLLAFALLYFGLVPAFYSDRYRLMLLPIYAALAAALWPNPPRGRLARAAAAIVLLAVLVPLARHNFEVQHQVWAELPRDVLQLAPAIDGGEAGSGSVMARKGHLGWLAHRPTVEFPRVTGAEALAEAARASGAGWLYYSWYEASIRPEFLALLDTTRTLPGLERVAVSSFPAAVLYRIRPEFGEPGWFGDPRERAVSEARAAIWTLDEVTAARGRSVLAADAFLRGEWREAIAMAKEARTTLPEDSLAQWVVEYSEAKLKGLDERVPEVAVLRTHPKFGWMTRAARRPGTLPRPTASLTGTRGVETAETGLSSDEDRLGLSP